MSINSWLRQIRQFYTKYRAISTSTASPPVQLHAGEIHLHMASHVDAFNRVISQAVQAGIIARNQAREARANVSSSIHVTGSVAQSSGESRQALNDYSDYISSLTIETRRDLAVSTSPGPRLIDPTNVSGLDGSWDYMSIAEQRKQAKLIKEKRKPKVHIQGKRSIELEE